MILVRNRGFRLKLSRSAQIPGPANVSPSDLSKVHPPEEFWRSLCSISPAEIMAANETPHDFFCPWIAGTGDYIASLLMETEQSLGPFLNIKDFDEESLEKTISDIEFQHLILCQNISNLTSYLWFHPQFETPAVTTALKDLKILQSRIETLQRRGQAVMNRLVGTLALKESRKSIQQSTSTKRLSQLAYVFLPLSLSTSIFGMNVIELQNIPLRVFFGTAGIALAMSLVLWLCLGWISRPEVLSNLIGIGKAIIILFKFFWQAPSHAAVLILFALCHSTTDTRLVLYCIGLWHILWDEKAPVRGEYPLSSIIVQKNTWSKFWYQRVAQVEDFVKTSQWRQRYLLQKKAGQADKDV